MKKENTFIFDLQLFDEPAKTPVTVSGNSNNEEINISINSGAVAATSKVGTGAAENLTVAGDNNEIKGSTRAAAMIPLKSVQTLQVSSLSAAQAQIQSKLAAATANSIPTNMQAATATTLSKAGKTAILSK